MDVVSGARAVPTPLRSEHEGSATSECIDLRLRGNQQPTQVAEERTGRQTRGIQGGYVCIASLVFMDIRRTLLAEMCNSVGTRRKRFYQLVNDIDEIIPFPLSARTRA